MARSGSIDLTGENLDGDQTTAEIKAQVTIKKPSLNGVTTMPPPTTATPSDAPANGADHGAVRKLEDDEGPDANAEDDDDSLLEDILDTAELEPYKADG
jgi:hypothetical protein